MLTVENFQIGITASLKPTHLNICSMASLYLQTYKLINNTTP